MRTKRFTSRGEILPFALLIAFAAALVIAGSSMLKKSDIVYETNIYINGNAGFAAYASSGDGSAGNPWVIKDKWMNPTSVEIGIYIAGTTDHFILRNCNVTGGTCGITLTSVSNGRLERCNTFSSYYPLRIFLGDSVRVVNCTFKDPIFTDIVSATDLRVVGCNVTYTGTPATSQHPFRFSSCHDLTIANCTSEFQGIHLYGINGDDISIHNNTFNAGWLYITSDSRVLRNVTVTNNTIGGSSFGIYLQYMNGVIVANNTVNTAYLETMTIQSTKNANFTGNHLTGLNGYYIASTSSNCTVAGDEITTSASSAYAVKIIGSHNMSFYNNTFAQISESDTSRIDIDAASENTTLSGNVFYGTTFKDHGDLTRWYHDGRGNYYSSHVTAYPYALSDGGTWWDSPWHVPLPGTLLVSKVKFDPFPLTPYITKSSKIGISITSFPKKTPSTIAGGVTAEVVDRQGQGIAAVHFFISNAAWKSSDVAMTNTAGTTWSGAVPGEISGALQGDGLYSVNVHAVDGNGVENWISSMFKVDNGDAPVITISSPSPSFSSDPTVRVEAIASDSDGIDNVWCRIRNSTWTGPNHAMSGSPYSFDLEVSGLAYDLYYIDVFAEDGLGNVVSNQTWMVLYPGLYPGYMTVSSHAQFSDYDLPGDGSEGDPWIIEGYLFDATLASAGYSVELLGTTDYVIIRHCKFVGIGMTAFRTAIMLSTKMNVLVEHCSFNAYTNPIVVSASSPSVGNIDVIQCTFTGSNLPIIIGTPFQCDDVSITGNTFAGTASATDFSFNYGNNLDVSGNEFDKGITLNGPSGISVVNNNFTSPGSAAISISSTGTVTVAENMVDGATFSCLSLNADSGFVHSNNFTRSQTAISITSGQFYIRNNTFDDVYYFIYNSGSSMMNVWNNSFSGSVGGGYMFTNAYSQWDDGAKGNIWWDYVDLYPNAMNDGEIWATPYHVPGATNTDRFPVVNASDPRSTGEFIKPGDKLLTNMLNVTVKLRVVPSAVQYSISDAGHYYGKFTLSETKPNFYSGAMNVAGIGAGTYNLTTYVTRSGKTAQFTRFFEFIEPNIEIVEPPDMTEIASPADIMIICANGATSAKFQVNGAYLSPNYTMVMQPDGVSFIGTFYPASFAGMTTVNELIVYTVTPIGELSTSSNFLYDAFPPVVSLTSPSGISHVSTIPIVVEAFDLDGIDTVYFTITKMSVPVASGFLTHGAGTTYAGSATLESGAYMIQITATDTYGIESAGSLLPFTVDISFVTITSPAPGYVAGDSLSISATFSGSPVEAWYHVTGDYKSGKQLLTFNPSTNKFEGTFSPGSFAGIASDNLLEVFFKDAGDNEFSSSLHFKYNADPSSITIEMPGAYATSASMIISVDCSDVDGIQSVLYELKDGATVKRSGTLSLVAGKYTAPELVGDLDSKEYSLVIHVIDTLGLETTVEKAFKLDLTDPAISQIVPHHDGATYTTTSFPASVEVSDEFTVASVHCRVHATSGNIDFDLSQTSPGIFVAIPPKVIPAGVLTATFTATSASGRTSSLTIQFNIDIAPPVITPVSFPSNGTRITASTFTISATCSDDTHVHHVSILVANSSREFNLTVTKDGMLYSTLVNTAQIFDGNYTISIVAIDNQGRTSTLRRTVVIDARAPIVSISQPVNGALVNSTTTSISINVVAGIEDESVGSVSCVLKNATWSSGSVSMVRSPDGKYRATLAIANVHDGVYTIEVSMTSNSGRSAVSSVQIVVDVPGAPVEPVQPDLFQQFFDWIVGIVSSIFAFIAGLLGIALVKRKRSAGNCIGGACNI
jgi:parallel beta-helix repeat protein